MRKVTNCTIKYLSVCPESSTIKQVIQSSNNFVIKSICNAALNAASGDIGLNDTQIKLFQKHKKSFSYLLSTSISIANKKKYIHSNTNKVHQLLPTLLSVVLDSIGSQFVIDNDISIQKICNHKSLGARATKGEEDP